MTTRPKLVLLEGDLGAHEARLQLRSRDVSSLKALAFDTTSAELGVASDRRRISETIRPRGRGVAALDPPGETIAV
jgi:hypothetical protein